MPYDDPEPDDPSMLVGIALPCDEATEREMAAAFADEFARIGFSAATGLSFSGHHGLEEPRKRDDPWSPVRRSST